MSRFFNKTRETDRLSNAHPFEQLGPAMVIDAVESTGVLSDARILALNSYENRVYQVGLDEGEPLIVKFYRPGRWTREQILEEHTFTQELQALDIPAVPPLANAQGHTLQEYKGFVFAVFERRGGRAPEFDNLDNLVVMGRFLGRLHKAGAVKPFRHRLSLNIEDFAEGSARYLLEHDFIPQELRPAYSSLSEDLILRLRQIFAQVPQPPLTRLHGDCHMGNVLWREGTPHFVDFDDTMTGPAIQDLWMLLSGDRAQMMAQLDKLVQGYNQFHDFNAAELPLIEALRTMRIMHYSAWLARRWDDPAFPQAFPWFNTQKYWAEHVLELREQMAALNEPPLQLI